MHFVIQSNIDCAETWQNGIASASKADVRKDLEVRILSSPHSPYYYMHYLYILLLNNNNLYTGTTANLKRRFDEHVRGNVNSTEFKGPVKLIHYEAYLLKSDADRRERFLKTTEGKRLLRQQIRDVLLLDKH